MHSDKVDLMIDIDAIRCFLAVVELGGFTLAAERLGVSQSAVSKQVRRLEDAGRRRLLSRQGQAVRLTPEGEAFLPYALDVERSYVDMTTVLQEAPLTGVIRLGIAEDMAGSELPYMLGAFRKRHPGVRLVIETGLSGLLSDRLAKGDFDLVMGKRPSLRQEARIVASEPLQWAMAPAFPHVCLERPLPLALHPEPGVTTALVIAALRTAQIDARVVVSSPSITGLRAGVLAGLAVGAFGRAFMPPGLVAVPEDVGLPALPPLEYGIERRPGGVSQAAETLAVELATVDQTRGARPHQHRG